MVTQRAPLTRVARQLAVALTSGLILLIAAAYLISPAEEAISATVASVATVPGQESVEGWIFSSDGRGSVVRVFRREPHRKLIAALKVGPEGFFYVRVHPGRYQVVFQHLSRRVIRNVFVGRGQAKYFLVKVRKRHHGAGIIPVLFTY